MINLTDDTTIHVFEGVKFMGVYDRNDILDIHYNIGSLDKDWARERNKDIELKILELREILDYNGTKLKPERVEEIEEEVHNLLMERDDITFKYGLAGEKFNQHYKDKFLVDSETWLNDGADRDGDFLSDETRFRFITEEMVTLYSKKNTDYGDAFAQSLDEDGLLVSKIRMGDKFKRFSQLIKNDALVDDETMRDTLIDLANYAAMTIMWLDDNE